MSISCVFIGSVTNFRIVDNEKRFLSISAQGEGVGFFSVTVWKDIDVIEGKLFNGAIISGSGAARARAWTSTQSGETKAEISIRATHINVLGESDGAKKDTQRADSAGHEEAQGRAPQVPHKDAARVGVQGANAGVSGYNPGNPAPASYAAGPQRVRNSGVSEADLNDEIPF